MEQRTLNWPAYTFFFYYFEVDTGGWLSYYINLIGCAIIVVYFVFTQYGGKS